MAEDSLIYVVICKIPDSQQLTSTPEGENGGDNDKEGHKPTPTPIGMPSLRKLSYPSLVHHRSAKLGIVLNKEYHGKGYGPEAVEWALDWAFRIAGLHRVWPGRCMRSWDLSQRAGSASPRAIKGGSGILFKCLF
jgi:GNAT superfamily N-acetyltransferase